MILEIIESASRIQINECEKIYKTHDLHKISTVLS